MEEKSVRKKKKKLPPGRGFRIKSTTSFQSFFKIALPEQKEETTLEFTVLS